MARRGRDPRTAGPDADAIEQGACRRPHHRVHRPGLPVGVVGRAVPAPPAMALRRRDRVAAADGRARRQRRGVRGQRASRRRSWPRRSRTSRATTACRSTPRSASGMSGPRRPAARSSRRACTRRGAEARCCARCACAFAGELLDDDSTRAGAARDAGLDPARSSVDGEPTRPSGRSTRTAPRPQPDRRRARAGRPARRGGRGRRYTCPSYEIVRRADGLQIDVPGFQPFAAYEVVLANLAPGAQPREPPATSPRCSTGRRTARHARGRGGLRHRARRGARASRPGRGGAASGLRRALVARLSGARPGRPHTGRYVLDAPPPGVGAGHPATPAPTFASARRPDSCCLTPRFKCIRRYLRLAGRNGRCPEAGVMK